MVKRSFVPFEKCLLGGVWLSAMKGPARSHAPHREDLELLFDSIHLHDGFVPIDLCLPSLFMSLRDIDLVPRQTNHLLALLHILAHRPFRHLYFGNSARTRS